MKPKKIKKQFRVLSPNTSEENDKSIGKEDRYTVLVAVHKKELYDALLPPAVKAANKNDGIILLFNVIEIPYHLPPSATEEYFEEREEFLSIGVEKLDNVECRVEMLVCVAHDVPYALKRTVHSRNVDLIIMGPHNSPVLNHTIEHTLLEDCCNILVTKQHKYTKFTKILVYAVEPHYINAMLEHANYLLSSGKSTIHILYDFDDKAKPFYFDTHKAHVEYFKKNHPKFTGKIIFDKIEEKTKGVINLPEVNSEKTCVLFQYKEDWLKKILGTSTPAKIEDATHLPVFLFSPKHTES